MPSELRPYQIAAIDQIRHAYQQGSRRICVVMPTGAGKTRTFAEMLRGAVAKQKRGLVLCHRAELVDQTVAALTAIGVQSGAVSASATAQPQPFAPVQVATIQTLLARKLRPAADIIVADEAHHYVADQFRTVIDDYPDALLLGPTATPERSDGRGLGEMFTRIVVGVRIRELIDLGFLVPAVVIAPRAKLKVGQIAQRPVDAYLAHARGRRALVFSPSVALAEEHAEEFRAHGLAAGVVTGTTSWGDRRGHFDAIRGGNVTALVGVYVFTEGFDVPAIDCVILARGCGSAGLYLQIVGRALRPSPGKTDALILDLTGTSHVHGHPHDDRQYSLQGRGIRKDDDSGVDQSYCRVCGAPINPGEACAECGTEPREPAALTVTGEKLVPYAHLRSDEEPARIARLAKWIAAARDHRPEPYKRGWAMNKYKVVYQDWPPRSIESMAQKAAREIEARPWST